MSVFVGHHNKELTYLLILLVHAALAPFRLVRSHSPEGEQWRLQKAKVVVMETVTLYAYISQSSCVNEETFVCLHGMFNLL